MNQYEFLIPIVFFLSLVGIIKVITDNRTRQKLIDKGLVDEKAKNLFLQGSQSMAALKWGMVLIALGLALALINMLPLVFEGPASMGLMLIFAGAAFLVYYFLAKKHEDKID